VSFSRAVAFVLKQEGSDLVQDPKDPGGLSRYGIALAKHPDLTAEDIRTMTPERAASLYSSQYWSPLRADELPEYLQLPMLDAAVNVGPQTAIRLLQAALYLSADGLIGPGTLGAARRADPHTTLCSLTSERIAHYNGLPGWPIFGRGWTRRAVLAALEAV